MFHIMSFNIKYLIFGNNCRGNYNKIENFCRGIMQLFQTGSIYNSSQALLLIFACFKILCSNSLLISLIGEDWETR